MTKLKNAPIENSTGLVAGWDMQSKSEKMFAHTTYVYLNVSDKRKFLQLIKMKVVSKEKCQGVYNMNFTENQFCAMSLSSGVITPGDSGGAFIIYQKDTAIQLGVVSFGYTFIGQTLPVVFTHVSKYLQWIYRVIDRSLSSGHLKNRKEILNKLLFVEN